LLLLEQIDRPLMRFPMDPNISDGRQPDFGGRIDRAEVKEVQTVQEVLLDVADAILDTAFLVVMGSST